MSNVKLHKIMREFGTIDSEAERRAMNTLFFRESEFEGRLHHVSVANYMAFLSMRGPEITEEVGKLRRALSAPSREHLERDLTFLLRARNWRFHNIACVAIACVGASDHLLGELWTCLRSGSWTSPQVAGTAAFADKEFDQRALKLVEDPDTYFKSIVSLAALLEARLGPELGLPQVAMSNIAEARQIDRDNSGSIATSWNGNLRAAFDVA
jgi:hypothetical protein